MTVSEFNLLGQGGLHSSLMLNQSNIPYNSLGLTSNAPLQAGVRLLGNNQANMLTGNPGNDVIAGRSGNDSLSGGGGNDRLYGEDGNDILKGGDGNDVLEGSRGNDRIQGDRGNDTLLGGDQNDVLVGGDGNDIIHAGTGIDQLTGNQGRDRFYINPSWGGNTLAKADVIADFTRGQDSLQLSDGLTLQALMITQDATGNTIIRHQATGNYLLVLSKVAGLGAADFVNPGTPTLPSTATISANTIKFSASDSEAAIAATGAARLRLGTQTFYIGTQQASSINQNPIIASFDSTNPSKRWVRTDYEVTGADGRGYGLFWSGTALYGIFSVDGTQGAIAQDFRRASGGATQPWLKSYGQGGGAKVAVLAKLNPATGEMAAAVYLSAVLSNGNSNSFAITKLSTNSAGNVVVAAKSYFAPRRPNGTAMTQVGTGSSPFDYTLEITPDLKTVVQTKAVGWN